MLPFAYPIIMILGMRHSVTSALGEDLLRDQYNPVPELHNHDIQLSCYVYDPIS